VTRRLFGSLCGLFLLVSLGRTAFAPLVEPLRAAFGVGPGAVGAVTSLVWFGTASSRLPTGYLMTRLGRPTLLVGAGASLVAGAVVTATAPTLGVVQAGAFVVGLSSGVYVVAAIPLVGALFPDRPGVALGVHGVSAQIAAVAAPGVVLAAVALRGWRSTFWLLALAGVIATVVVVVTARRTDLPATTAPDADFRGALRHWRVLLAGVAVVAVTGFVWQGVFNFYVTFLTAEREFTTGTANVALSVLFAAGVPGMLLGGRLADRLPVVPVLLATVAGFALGVVALTVVTGLWPVLAVSVVVGVLMHGLFPALDTYVLGALPDSHRASAYAVYSGVALSIQSGGSGAVGALTARGLAFGTVFRRFALALLPVVAVLAVLHAVGWFPADGVDADGDTRAV